MCECQTALPLREGQTSGDQHSDHHAEAEDQQQLGDQVQLAILRHELEVDSSGQDEVCQGTYE